jgi:hypothetical protein
MKLEMLGKMHLDHNVLGLVALGRVDSKIPVSPCPATQELLLFWLIIVNKIFTLCRLKGFEKCLSHLLDVIFCRRPNPCMVANYRQFGCTRALCLMAHDLPSWTITASNSGVVDPVGNPNA